MPIERLGYQTDRQIERDRKALERVKLMVEEAKKTIERYSLLDEDDANDTQSLTDFEYAASNLIDRLTTKDDRGENGRN